MVFKFNGNSLISVAAVVLSFTVTSSFIEATSASSPLFPIVSQQLLSSRDEARTEISFHRQTQTLTCSNFNEAAELLLKAIYKVSFVCECSIGTIADGTVECQSKGESCACSEKCGTVSASFIFDSGKNRASEEICANFTKEGAESSRCATTEYDNFGNPLSCGMTVDNTTCNSCTFCTAADFHEASISTQMDCSNVDETLLADVPSNIFSTCNFTTEISILGVGCVFTLDDALGLSAGSASSCAFGMFVTVASAFFAWM